jgi:transcriptional regulator with XRE-family HTH domain
MRHNLYMADDVLFSEWLIEQIQRKQIKQADLAKAAGLRPSTINKLLNSKTKRPSGESCVALANALGMSPISVFRAAKWLSAEPEFPERDDLIHVVGQLPGIKRKELLAFAEVMLKFEKEGPASIK